MNKPTTVLSYDTAQTAENPFTLEAWREARGPDNKPLNFGEFMKLGAADERRAKLIALLMATAPWALPNYPILCGVRSDDVDSLDGEKPSEYVAGSEWFANYTDAGANVKKVVRSAAILRMYPGESYESENYGAIVEMTDGRVLTLVTNSRYGGIDEWDVADAEAQLVLVEENAKALRAVLDSWPVDERKAKAMEAGDE